MVVMRKASVDFGTKRSGIAITDPSGKVITTTRTVPPSEVIKELKKVDSLSEIVVGLPLNLKGEFTKSTRKAVDMAIEISEKMSPVPVYMVDERFTSNMANYELRTSHMKKKMVDELSASIILQDYMSANIKSYRVHHIFTSPSKNVADFFRMFSPKRMMLIGSALRGLEEYDIAEFDIYENDPIYFRLREVNIFKKKSGITLHFGVLWDIILSSLKSGDLVVMDSYFYKEKVWNRFPAGVKVAIECENGFVSVDHRNFKFFEVNFS